MKKGDKVKVVADWVDPEARNAIALVDNFQNNGTMKFVKIKWLGKNGRSLEETCGVLFPSDELRKV